MKKSILLLFVAMAMAATALAQTREAGQANYYQQAEAEYAVYTTLRKIDSGSYGEIWKRAASKAKGGLTESAWTETVRSMRKTFGTYRDRNAERHGFSDEMSSGEKGLFYVAIFQTQFSSVTAEEKVVMAFEAGEWKLAGYFLKTSSSK